MVSSVYGWCRPYTDGVVGIRTASLVYGRRRWYTDGVVGIRTASLVYGRRRWYTDGVVGIRTTPSAYGRQLQRQNTTQQNCRRPYRRQLCCVVFCSVGEAVVRASSGCRPYTDGVVSIRTAAGS